jgi:hypothetical protein
MLRTNWVIKRGERFDPVYTYTDDNDEPQSIVGHTLTGYIRSGRSVDSDLLATLTIETVDAAAGEYSPVIESTATDDTPANYLAGWGSVWITGPSTDNRPVQIVEAHPVSFI